ncbi:MAG: DUF305 domain-containing protein [Gemmatimonadota bacterium]
MRPSTRRESVLSPGCHKTRSALHLTLVLVSGTACGSGASAPAPAPIPLASGAGVVTGGSDDFIERAAAAAAAYTPADVEFMSGMIPHHAQAIVMAGWCPSQAAGGQLRALCERIAISQRDEIRMMRDWLAERGEVVPDSMATRHLMRMGDTIHAMLMPGMLTDEELATLGRARGTEFDRLFLTGMIGHHFGAITMVETLFAQPAAGQEETVFRFASDVLADQSAEIQRMQGMLEGIPR